MRAIIVSSIALGALALTGCEDPEVVAAQDAAQAAAEQAAQQMPDLDGQVQVAQVAQAPTAAPRAESTVDWEAARAARAAAPVTDAQIQVQSVGTSAAPEVPVLLPSGIVQAQNARAPAMVTTDDGYFATYQMPAYDAIVNGTKSMYGAGDGARDDVMNFTVSEGSASLAFARFGADYLIEFECRQVDGGESCITEDEARAFADSLFVAQTR